MTITALLRPRSIAIVGASPIQGSFGAQLHSVIQSMGYDGKVHLVNPGSRVCQRRKSRSEVGRCVWPIGW